MNARYASQCLWHCTLYSGGRTAAVLGDPLPAKLRLPLKVFWSLTDMQSSDCFACWQLIFHVALKWPRREERSLINWRALMTGRERPVKRKHRVERMHVKANQWTRCRRYFVGLDTGQS